MKHLHACLAEAYASGRVLIGLLLMLAAQQATAASWTCTVSATGPAFGTYNPFATAADEINGAVNATCTLLSGNSATITIVDSFSTGSSNSYANRTLRSGTNILNYNLYYDAAYSEIRGNGSGGSLTGSASLTLTSGNPTQTATGVIYGKIPAGQNVAPGTYTDTIVVTITF